MKRLGAALLSLALTGCASGYVRQYERIETNSQIICKGVELKDGRSSPCFSAGTGFVLEMGARPYIITNAHVVMGLGGPLEKVDKLTLTIGQDASELELLAIDDDSDTALLRSGPIPGAIQIPGGSARIGERVFSIGFPQGQKAIDEGIVSATLEGYVLLSSDALPGESGSPVYHKTPLGPRVLGYVTKMNEKGNFSLMIPIEQAIDLLQRYKADPQKERAHLKEALGDQYDLLVSKP